MTSLAHTANRVVCRQTQATAAPIFRHSNIPYFCIEVKYKKLHSENLAVSEKICNFAPLKARVSSIVIGTQMIIVQVKEGENIEKALKKFKRKYERTGVVKELRARQAFQKPSVVNRKKMMKAVYVQKLRSVED